MQIRKMPILERYAFLEIALYDLILTHVYFLKICPNEHSVTYQNNEQVLSPTFLHVIKYMIFEFSLPLLCVPRIHEFLKLENEIGSITRQEAVSMVSPCA